MIASICPFPKHQFFDNNGDPASGYQLFCYAAGTTIYQDTYAVFDGSTLNSNPIILDAAGRATIFLGPGLSYKFSLATPTDPTAPPTSPLWTVDDVTTVPVASGNVDVSVTFGETVALNDAIYLSDGNGGLTAGRWYKTDSDLYYASSAASAIGFALVPGSAGTAGTVRTLGQMTGFAGLTIGGLYYLGPTAGGITITAPTNARVVGQAYSATALMVSHWLPTKVFPLGIQSDFPPTWKPPGWSTYGGNTMGRIHSQYVTVGNVGAGADTLMTYTLPAATVNADGMAVKILAWGKTANNANAKTIRAYFGATELLGAAGVSLMVNELGHWMFGSEVLRTANATQRCVSSLCCGPVAASFTVSVGDVSAGTVDLTASTPAIQITGEGVANNDIIQEGLIIWLVC